MNNGGAIVVTGASTGIGQACALRLDALGYRVFASALSAEEGAELKNRASPQLEIVVLDIRDAAAIENARQRVAAATGDAGVAGLVNNAGILGCAPLELLSMAQVRQVFEVNVIGQIAMTQAFLPLLRRGAQQGTQRGPSRIINIGSLAGRSALPFTSPYNASKFALRALTDTWRLELRRQGIAVVLVEPGMVVTPIWKKGSDLAGEMSGAAPPATLDFYPSFARHSAQVSALAQKSGVTSEAIARVVVRALQVPKPRARYTVGKEAQLLLLLEKLPIPLRDWLVSRRFGM